MLSMAEKNAEVADYLTKAAGYPCTFRAAIESAPFRTAALLTGPEGGLERSEVEQAQRAGLQICTLGSRILRCETAPLCALSALMYAAGEF